MFFQNPNDKLQSKLMQHSKFGSLCSDGKQIWWQSDSQKLFRTRLKSASVRIENESQREATLQNKLPYMRLTADTRDYWIDFGPNAFAGPTAALLSSRRVQYTNAWLKLFNGGSVAEAQKIANEKSHSNRNSLIIICTVLGIFLLAAGLIWIFLPKLSGF